LTKIKVEVVDDQNPLEKWLNRPSLIVKITAVMLPSQDVWLPNDDRAIERVLKILSIKKIKVSGTKSLNLTVHPWAGSNVSFKIKVEGEIGQVGFSRGVWPRLPEWSFYHPISIELIKQRKIFFDFPQDRTLVADISTNAIDVK
jgi:hypothetical protein